MAKLTAQQEQTANAWLHDVLFWGGVLKNNKRACAVADYHYMYGGNSWKKNQGLPYAKAICEAITARPVETKKMQLYDAALLKLADFQFIPDLTSTSGYSGRVRKPAEMLARYVAWFCAKQQLWWDTTYTSDYMMEEIKNNTILGKALWDAGCFTNQGNPTGKASAGTGTRSQSSGTPGQPQNPFKSRGPLSNVCIDLKGQPNQKIQLSGEVFYILGVDTNGNLLSSKDAYCAYIRPVEADPRIQQQYVDNGTNKVLVGSAKGYGFCPCVFDNQADADAFLGKVRANTKPGGKAAGMVVAKKSAQGNGYFKVGTVYGDCYISAAKLNEDLNEAVEEKTPYNYLDDPIVKECLEDLGRRISDFHKDR